MPDSGISGGGGGGGYTLVDKIGKIRGMGSEAAKNFLLKHLLFTVFSSAYHDPAALRILYVRAQRILCGLDMYE